MSVLEFHVISVHCSIFNWGARGGIFFHCCLNLCEFTWSVLSIFKYYALFKFILLCWIAHSSVLTWKLSPKTPWYFGNHINFVSSWHLPELDSVILMGPLNSVYSMILWETCFIYKLLFPSFLPEPDVQQLLGFFDCFFSFWLQQYQILWSWNRVSISPANALVSMQAILCQCCTYWM